LFHRAYLRACRPFIGRPDDGALRMAWHSG
jgi:hypothetical protein